MIQHKAYSVFHQFELSIHTEGKTNELPFCHSDTVNFFPNITVSNDIVFPLEENIVLSDSAFFGFVEKWISTIKKEDTELWIDTYCATLKKVFYSFGSDYLPFPPFFPEYISRKITSLNSSERYNVVRFTDEIEPELSVAIVDHILGEHKWDSFLKDIVQSYNDYAYRNNRWCDILSLDMKIPYMFLPLTLKDFLKICATADRNDLPFIFLNVYYIQSKLGEPIIND